MTPSYSYATYEWEISSASQREEFEAWLNMRGQRGERLVSLVNTYSDNRPAHTAILAVLEREDV